MLIEIDTHFHSVASTHAYSTVKEIASSTKKSGLKGFALTDHAPNINDAPHVWHFHNLKVLPRYIEDVIMLKGAEANIIDLDGNIDLNELDLSYLEWVIASFHYRIEGATSEDYTNAYIKLAKNNEAVDLIGHSTTTWFDFDYEKVIKVFKEYNKIVEINESSIICNKSPKENIVKMLNVCKKYNLPIAVNSDGHYCDIVGCVSESEKIIEELNFPKELIINSDENMLFDYIKNKRKNFTI